MAPPDDVVPSAAAVAQWFAHRLPSGWSVGAPEIVTDNDEILVILRPEGSVAPDRFREATRDHRMALADEAGAVFGRKVAWAVRAGGEVQMFTTASIPVMTRLRLPERRVLDTLIDAGVARSRSDALAWCVRLVGATRGSGSASCGPRSRRWSGCGRRVPNRRAASSDPPARDG